MLICWEAVEVERELYAAAVAVAELAYPRQVKSSHLGPSQRATWRLSARSSVRVESVAVSATVFSSHPLVMVEYEQG